MKQYPMYFELKGTPPTLLA